MSNSLNRLQFVHCDTLFATREEAKAYVQQDKVIYRDRPALYAEPMVLKYGDEKNPNIILAIGSVGDGQTASANNQVFFIDFAQLDIENNYSFIDSNTIAFNVNKTISGNTIIDSNVKLQPTKIVDNKEYQNSILNDENGLFSHVNVKVDEDIVIVNINGKEIQYELPDTIISGQYNKETIELELNTRKGEKLIVDFKEVIPISNLQDNIIVKDVDGDLYASINFNPVTNELILSNNEKISLSSSTQANFEKELQKVNVIPEITPTITTKAKKTDDGTLISSDVNIKSDSNNIIKSDIGGIYANVSLEYDKATNKLTLITTNGSKEISLSLHSLVEDAYYDTDTNSIILLVSIDTPDGIQIKKIPIEVGALIVPLEVDQNINSKSAIDINIEYDESTNVNKISAILNISRADDNLASLDSVNGNLYVRGHANYMKMNWATTEVITIQNAFDRLQENLALIENDVLNSVNENINKINIRIDELTDFGYTDL